MQEKQLDKRLSNITEVFMEEEYDFSKAKKNPYIPEKDQDSECSAVSF